MACKYCFLGDCPGDCEQGRASYREHEERQIASTPPLFSREEFWDLFEEWETSDTPECFERAKAVESFIDTAVKAGIERVLDDVQIEFIDQKSRFDQGYNYCALKLQTRIYDIRARHLGAKREETKG